MRLIATAILVIMISGCGALDWMREDADGNPATPGTKGQTIGRAIQESSSLFGPFAGGAALIGMVIAALSRKEGDE